MNYQTGWGLRSFTRSMIPRRWLAGGSNKSNQEGNLRFTFVWFKNPMLCFCSTSMASQGGEQCGSQVCAQAHRSGAGSKDHWDHSGEDDRSAAGGGEDVHAEGDPSPQHGEGTFLNQYVQLLLTTRHFNSSVLERFQSVETVFVSFSYSHWFLWVHDLHIFGVWPVSITTNNSSLTCECSFSH